MNGLDEEHGRKHNTGHGIGQVTGHGGETRSQNVVLLPCVMFPSRVRARIPPGVCNRPLRRGRW